MSHLSTIEAIEAVERHSTALAPQGEQEIVLCAALLMYRLTDADYEDVQAMANHDQDAYGAFIDAQELGNRVYEMAVDIFPQLAQNELREREQGSRDALEVELELRRSVLGLAGNF